ncbi:MAG: GGDEF domain-containing protein, partial [Lachnospiraceae bacterium]|nr:GGDEF domain-containing protein [Lachnospiraceae bacterium]
VCMLDIDYFKEYNDTYGHQKGDECIKKIGKLLKKEIKSVKNTFCARYGGDEFVIFYQNKSDEEIHRIAARLKKRVQDLKIQHDASEINSVVSISQGIYNRVPSEEDSLEDYLRMADKALYRVKQSGRNGICIKNG